MLTIAILAAACGGDDTGPGPDQLTTPEAANAIECERVPVTAADLAGTWSLDWYCDGYTEGNGAQVPRPCDPARLPVGLDDDMSAIASGETVTIRVGALTAALEMSAGSAAGSIGDDLISLYACADHHVLSIVDDYGDNSRTLWRARAERL